MEERREGRARAEGARAGRAAPRPRTTPTSTRGTGTTKRKTNTSAEIHTRRRTSAERGRPERTAGTRENAGRPARARRPARPTPRPAAGRGGPPRGPRTFLARLTGGRPGAALPIGRGLIALITAVVLIVTGVAWNRIASLNSAVTLLGGLGLGGGSDGAVDILLVGTDSRVDAKGNPLSPDELKWLRVGDDITTSTDTILLIRIPNDGSGATAISIPRDSYVEVPGLGMSKINAAYGATREQVRRTEVESGTAEAKAEADGTKAGRKALIESVAGLTGVTVDHYAEVGLLGFALLTDAVGGVDVCLKNAVNEPLSGAHFKAGRQTLNGPKALSFVRQRHDLPRGDLDRITRQQVYMASLAQKILSTKTLTNPGKLTELEHAVSRSVVIDDGWDVVKLAEQMKDLTGGNVKFTTIPVVSEHGWSDDGTQSVVEVDPKQVQTFVDRQLGKASTVKTGRGAYQVDVVNAGTVDGLAANVSGLLTAKGYREGATSSKPMNEFNSIVFAKDPDGDGAKQLVKDLGGDIEIRKDTSLPDDRLRAVLTNTYTGTGAIWNTGPQGDNANDQTSGASDGEVKATPAIKADTNGPVCVN
ncbi:LCP family protein [Gordonia sp. PP30]|uniref:LCP family protein n=1 Tax=Gordonia sp. PP30 TaxID=2935861 RepID=UPI001FFF3ADC|nr:LCP family protein [Gordonia sp. PP30]UQE76279.1 LCP family protein [Gordonia sp. PP30]